MFSADVPHLTRAGKSTPNAPMKFHRSIVLAGALSFGLLSGSTVTVPAATNAPVPAWPALTSQARPWTYWWWMASAVDKTNLTRELQRFHDAGLGGVHIIPIYGAKGWESNYVRYLGPQWMDLMGYTVSEAQRLGLGVDMSTGSGWCFGGPTVSELDANASVVVQTFDLGVGEKLTEKFDRKTIQALVAFGPDGKTIDLTGSIPTDGEVSFAAPGNWTGTNTVPPKTWRVYAISQKPSPQKVKRAAPGGEGWMLNPFYPPAMSNYLGRFTEAFAGYKGLKPRSQYQDSYEYRSDWAPNLFAEFERRRGYRLQTELPALFSTDSDDHANRVKSDYRETLSDIMVEETEPLWVKWSHQHGFITRYQAHGSPGNLLDLYAAADIPETEMFRTNQNPLISKFASSAAHVKGGNLVSAETGTWLNEHFTETLGELKSLADVMFLAGVNHIFYHGTCYSPDAVAWPGWVFYASTEMNARNSIWHDVPALNDYIARCQSILQSGKPDNDVLLYWPIHDYWNEPSNASPGLQVEMQRFWFKPQPISRTARELWERGYAFDYVSDRQLASAKAGKGGVRMAGGIYKAIVIPPCNHMPLSTFEHLLDLAKSGVVDVIFEEHLPNDVPGWGNLEKRRSEFKKMLGGINLIDAGNQLKKAKVGRGNGLILVGDSKEALAHIISREPMTDAGLSFIHRRSDHGRDYFIANRSGTNFDGWVTLICPAQSSVVILDPMNGTSGVAASKPAGRLTQIYLQLPAGSSVILRTFQNEKIEDPTWTYWQSQTPDANPQTVIGTWKVKFISGGPVLPTDGTTSNLASWTEFGDTNAQNFAGTAVYSITFDAPGSVSSLQAVPGSEDTLKRGQQTYQLDLGKVCQSARVRLNDKDYGPLIAPPFRVVVDNVQPKDNRLEVEVTSVSANRIRDLDRRDVPWKNFHDINFVNIDYRRFNAADWPLTDCGLLGPVTLTGVGPWSAGQ
jgi:hypothetical protein